MSDVDELYRLALGLENPPTDSRATPRARVDPTKRLHGRIRDTGCAAPHRVRRRRRQAKRVRPHSRPEAHDDHHAHERRHGRREGDRAIVSAKDPRREEMTLGSRCVEARHSKRDPRRTSVPAALCPIAAPVVDRSPIRGLRARGDRGPDGTARLLSRSSVSADASAGCTTPMTCSTRRRNDAHRAARRGDRRRADTCSPTIPTLLAPAKDAPERASRALTTTARADERQSVQQTRRIDTLEAAVNGSDSSSLDSVVRAERSRTNRPGDQRRFAAARGPGCRWRTRRRLVGDISRTEDRLLVLRRANEARRSEIAAGVHHSRGARRRRCSRSSSIATSISRIARSARGAHRAPRGERASPGRRHRAGAPGRSGQERGG